MQSSNTQMYTDTYNINIGSLFQQVQRIKVPPYQRFYDWEENDVSDFLDDIFAVNRTQEGSHFFGSLVFIERITTQQGAQVQGNTSYLEVVDGQQRLATFVLLFAELERIVERVMEDARTILCDNEELSNYLDFLGTMKETLNEKILAKEMNAKLLKTERFYKLRLNKVDKDFFEKLISENQVDLSEKPPQSHQKLMQAKATIIKRLQEELEWQQYDENKDPQRFEHFIKNLAQLVDSVLQRCTVVVITTTDETQAFSYFMSLNNRGKSLAPSSLMRAHTLKATEGSDDLQNKCQEYWDDILSESENIVEDFLLAYYPSRLGKRANKYNYFKDYLNSFFSANTPQKITEEVKNLKEEFEYFKALNDGTWPFESPSVSKWETERLRLLIKELKHTLCLPLLLAARKELKKEDEFASIVNIIERCAFRYINVCKAHSGKLSEVYYKHCRAIRDKRADYDPEDLRTELNKLIKDRAKDDLFISNLYERLNYDAKGSRSLIKYFLTTLESYYDWAKQENGKPQPTPTTTHVFDLRRIHIEHIYPQNAQEGHKNSDMEEIKNSIANLTFWGEQDNKEASNAPFIQKKTDYGKSSIKLTRELSQFTEWTKEEYEKRKQILSDMALKVFSLDY